MNWIGRTAAEAFGKCEETNEKIIPDDISCSFMSRPSIVVGSGRRLISMPGFPGQSRHALIAGAIGGYFVWGRFHKINAQINLYLLSRVIIALGKKYGWNVEASSDHYAWFSAALWGIVMFLFEDEPDSLHSSLKLSMDEIYRYRLPLTT